MRRGAARGAGIWSGKNGITSGTGGKGGSDALTEPGAESFIKKISLNKLPSQPSHGRVWVQGREGEDEENLPWKSKSRLGRLQACLQKLWLHRNSLCLQSYTVQGTECALLAAASTSQGPGMAQLPQKMRFTPEN